MANETVTLTAELKDQMSAPLEKARAKVDGFTDAVVDGAKKQQAAVDKSTAQISNSVGRQNRLFGGMTGVVGRATQGTSRLFSGMASSVRRSLDGLPEYSSRQGEKTGAAFGNSMKSGMKIAAGAVATYFGAQMFGGFIAEAGRASDATDKFKATMNFAGIDAGGIEKATAAAKAYADQTVYDLPTIQNTFAQLASNGIENYSDLTKAAGNLNAVAGGNAETFKSVSRTLTQSAGAGRLMTEDWNMLADAIPGASGPLQKAMREAGAFEGNFKKAMENGEISSAEFNSALMKLGTKPVAVEAAKSTKTFEGALGNLNATINSKLMGALDKIKPAATTAINALTGGLGKALDWTGDAAQGLYDLVVKGDFSGAFHRAFNVEEDSPVVDMLLDIRDAAIELPDKLKAVADKVWEFREPITVIGGLILTLLIPRFVQMGVEALKAAVKTRVAWAMTQGAAMRASAMNVIAAWQIIGGWVLMGATALIQGARIAAGWLLAMGPVGWIIGIIALLVAAFVWAYNNVGWFRDGVDTAMRAIGDAFQAVGKWFGDVWNGIVGWWNSTMVPFFDGLGQWFSGVWQGAVDAVKAVGKWFSDVWQGVVNWWNATMVPFLQALAAPFIAAFDWIKRLIWNATTIAVALFRKLVDFWNGVLLPALRNLGSFFGTILNWIYTVLIKPVIDFIVGAFNGLVTFWNTIFIPGLQAVGNFIGTIFSWIWNTLIKPVVDFIVAAFNNLVSFWNTVVIPGLQALGDFIGTVMNWIYNTLIKPVIDFIVGAFNGLVDFWNGTLKPVIDTVGKWFSDVIGGAITGVGDFIDDLKKGFDGFIAFWTNTLKPIVDAISAAFNTVRDAIGEVLGKIGEFANNPLGGIQDMLGIAKDENGQGIMPSNSGGGVYPGNGVRFAGGGVLGGYAPGRDSILARLSPGESVLVPELTRAIGPQNIMAANAQASGGRPAGSGPSLTSGYSAAGRQAATGGGVTIAAGAVQVTVQAGPEGISAAGMAQIQAAFSGMLEDALSTSSRRDY